MKHYKDQNNNIYAYEEGQTPREGLTEISDTERDAIIEQKRAEAQAALEATVPEAVSMRQARLALHQMNLLNKVDAAIAKLPAAKAEEAQIEWEYSTSIERSNALAQTIGALMDLTEVELDDLFKLARGL
jgi:hypothetical protein